MKFEISKQVFEKYPKKTFLVVVAKDINNMTAKSRDIILKLKNVAKKNGKDISNINPFVNYFNAFILDNEVSGFYADLKSIYGDLKLDFLEKKTLFLPHGEKEIMFCEKEVVFFDEHSVTHRFQDKIHGERVRIVSDSKNIFVCFAFDISSSGEGWQLVSEFANDGKKLFGGNWNVYSANQKENIIEVDYESKTLVESLDVEQDLKNLSKSEIKGDKGIKKRRGESLRFVNKDSLLNFLNDEIVFCLKDLYKGVSFENKAVLSNSPNLQFGHFSTNIAFELVKVHGSQVVDIAEDLAMKLSGETRVSSYFTKIEATKNGFVNFFLSEKFLLEFSLKSVNDFTKFSSCEVGKGKVILIESPSANPNKAMHIGHLLNVFLGKSLMSIFAKLGFEIYNDNIINDKGLPICKAMWALKNFAGDSTPEKEGLKPDHLVDKYYVLGAQKFEEDKKVEAEVRQMLLDWEVGDSETVALWKKMVSWVLEGHKETMGKLGEAMGHIWFESEIYEEGKKIVLNSVDNEKIVKTSDGAVIGKLEKEYGVPDVVLLKSDGTSLYHTQDLGLTKLKVEKFNPWKAIWVVGNEQITHFQRLFSLIDSLGLLPIDNLYHLAYGYVFDKNGKKMSSRAGEVLTADELLDMMEKKLSKEVALGALKYAFLSSDPFKDMKFDLEQAILFTGRSGPYVMYAYARASNILKNIVDVKGDFGDVEFTNLDRQILLKCFDYPNVIVSSANNYSPSILAEYLYDLAKLFNQMYETEKVLDSKGSERDCRILIVKFVKMILGDGLLLLRIKPLERM